MTAFTLTEMLSRVMQSWSGTSTALTRMSIRCQDWRIGTTRHSPGFMMPENLPNVNLTPRSYSLTTFRPLNRKTTTMPMSQ